MVHRLSLALLGQGVLLVCAVSTFAQNPPTSHVIIPNPTPRPPDIKQQYDQDSPQLKGKQKELLIRNQLRAREVWLQANQLLFLAQQLREEVLAGKGLVATTSNSAKAGEIEKLAKSIEKKMRFQ